MIGTENLIEVGQNRYPAAAIVDALRPHIYEVRIERMTQVLAHRLGSVALGLEDLHKNHNGHACIRTAEALGVQDLVAAEIRNPFPLEMTPDEAYAEGRRQDRLSRWAHRWVDLHRLDSAEAMLAWARARGMRIFGAGPRATLSVEEVPTDRPLLVLFGNEKEGLQPSTFEACDDAVRLPMFGFTESFNVSVSVGMALASVTRRIRGRLAREGRTGDLSEARKTALLARWCAADVRGAEAILRKKLG